MFPERRVPRLKDLRQFHAQAHEVVDIEKAPVIDFFRRDAPVRQPVGLLVEQLVQPGRIRSEFVQAAVDREARLQTVAMQQKQPVVQLAAERSSRRSFARRQVFARRNAPGKAAEFQESRGRLPKARPTPRQPRTPPARLSTFRNRSGNAVRSKPGKCRAHPSPGSASRRPETSPYRSPRTGTNTLPSCRKAALVIWGCQSISK